MTMSILGDMVDAAATSPTSPRIAVTVRLFAAYREAAGTNRLDESLPTGSRVRDLVERLSPRIPALSRTPGLVAVNQEYVGADYTLSNGDEVALIPPVSGGAGA